MSRQLSSLANSSMPVIKIQAQIMGQSIPQGMAQGINQNSAQVTQAVGAMAHSAVSSGRSSLGISSPSRVFYQMGRSSAEGYRAGLLEGGSTVGEAAHSLASDTAAQFQEGLRTGRVYMGSEQVSKDDGSGNGSWRSGFDPTRFKPEFISLREWKLDEQLVGGFGSGVKAASNGITPIASSYGLQVGDVWARSVVTGADTVLQSSQFAALTVPQIGSALAKTALGQMGLLPPAGSGAEYYNTTQGNAGTVTMTPIVHATIHVSVDGTPLTVTAQNVVNASMKNLVNSIGAQRG